MTKPYEHVFLLLAGVQFWIIWKFEMARNCRCRIAIVGRPGTHEPRFCMAWHHRQRCAPDTYYVGVGSLWATWRENGPAGYLWAVSIDIYVLFYNRSSNYCSSGTGRGPQSTIHSWRCTISNHRSTTLIGSMVCFLHCLSPMRQTGKANNNIQ